MPEYRDVETPIGLEMIERMPKSLSSGTFVISVDLIEKAGNLGAVLQAVIERANHIHATLTISVETERTNRFAMQGDAIQFYNSTTVEWAR